MCDDNPIGWETAWELLVLLLATGIVRANSLVLTQSACPSAAALGV